MRAAWLTSDGQPFVDLLGRMTLLLLLVQLEPWWYLKMPITVVAVAGLLIPQLTRKAPFWFLVTLIVTLAFLRNWFSIDNHKYLITYWCLAFASCLLTGDDRKLLALNARLLIGLCFTFAALWKMISPDFLNGTFFHFTLLADHRFIRVFEILDALHIGPLPADVLTANDHAFEHLKDSSLALAPVPLHDIPSLHYVAVGMAWWTLIIESGVAIAFLWPAGQEFSKWRDIVLLVFLVTTYPIASVIGFGWIVVVLGLAQSSARAPWVRVMYVMAFVILPLAELPYGTVARGIAGFVTSSMR